MKEQRSKCSSGFEWRTLLSAEVTITTLAGKDPRGYFLWSGQADTHWRLSKLSGLFVERDPRAVRWVLSEGEPKGYLPRWTQWKRSSSPRSWRSKWWLTCITGMKLWWFECVTACFLSDYWRFRYLTAGKNMDLCSRLRNYLIVFCRCCSSYN